MATKEPSARRKRKKLWWGVCAGFGGSILPTGGETVHPLAAKSRSFFSFEDTFPIMKLKLGDITKLGKGLISVCVCWAWRKSEISGVMAKADIKPKSMHYVKKWSDDVENLHRFQQAGYRDEVEYKQVKQVDMVEHWPETGFVKKLQRRDNTFYYYDKQRECEDREVHKVKVYVY